METNGEFITSLYFALSFAQKNSWTFVCVYLVVVPHGPWLDYSSCNYSVTQVLNISPQNVQLEKVFKAVRVESVYVLFCTRLLALLFSYTRTQKGLYGQGSDCPNCLSSATIGSGHQRKSTNEENTCDTSSNYSSSLQLLRVWSISSVECGFCALSTPQWIYFPSI